MTLFEFFVIKLLFLFKFQQKINSLTNIWIKAPNMLIWLETSQNYPIICLEDDLNHLL
jgi:hypothetical protein